MQAIRDQKATEKREKKDKQDQALKNAAEIEDEQCQEDLQRAATSNAHKAQLAIFHPPTPAELNLIEDEIGTEHTTLRMSVLGLL
jgi:hypothetical protein